MIRVLRGDSLAECWFVGIVVTSRSAADVGLVAIRGISADSGASW